MPNGRGGNLTQPLKKVLINTPGPLNLGTYLDTTTGFRVLQFTKAGYSLPWTPGSTMTVQFPQAPILKLATVQLSNVAPLNPLNYNYAVTILKKVRKPGVDQYDWHPHQKPYGGILPSVTIPTIANAELNTMRADLILQINSDNSLTRQPAYTHPGASVIAGIPLLLNAWDAASACTIDGEAVAAAASQALFIANINAVPGYIAIQDPVTAANILVFKTTRDGALPVFANTAGTVAEVATNGLIGFVQRYPDAQFELKVNTNVGVSRTIRQGRYAFLTNDEVFQVFSHIPNMGRLAQETWPEEMPVRGADYVRVNINIVQNHNDLQGASHLTRFVNAIEVYIPVAEWAPAGGVNDRWAGVANNRIMDAGAAENIADVLALWQT